MHRLTSFVLLGALSACAAATDPITLGDGGTGTSDGGGRNGPDGSFTTPDATPAIATGELGCSKMDVLFVIDNSGSMSEEQAALAASFPKMVAVLEQLRGGGVDFRVGVTTTSFGFNFLGIQAPSDDGTLLKTTDMTQAWLSRGEPNLAARFATLATVGTSGSAVEQPLKAAKEAVTSRVTDGKNAGFFRKDALLAIVLITDEDDGSSDPGALPIPGFSQDIPVSDLKAAIDGATGGPGRWAAAVIAGDQDPECMSGFGSAAYGERLKQFVTLLGPNGLFGSICSGDLSGELDRALTTFTAACEEFPILR